mgnify:CR=1 FL=1
MRRYYSSIDETLDIRKLENGLQVVVVPRKGFQKKLAYFVTDFGSVHTDFSLEGEEHHVSAGIAHFLEHKMFELPDKDVSGLFAELGANVNAFTSYDMTAYYFSCTHHFEENLRLLLEFVSTPYFPEESVLREQGIIDQEIAMSMDAPESRVFEAMLEKMYEKHPIRVPILGTQESIRQITPQMLRLCHDAFYTPGNMILCVVGDVDADAVERCALEVLGSETRPVGKKLRQWQESMTAYGDSKGQMEVAMPTFQLGYKCECAPNGIESIRQEIVADLAAEALFGESSALYLDMYEKGWIDASFGGGFESVDGCAMLTCGGDSDVPEKVRSAVEKRAQELAREGVPEADFLRMKRSALGRRMRDLDSFDSTAFRICAYYFAGFDYFGFPAIYEQVSQQEIQAFLQQVVRKERGSLSVIYPLAEK